MAVILTSREGCSVGDTERLQLEINCLETQQREQRLRGLEVRDVLLRVTLVRRVDVILVQRLIHLRHDYVT